MSETPQTSCATADSQATPALLDDLADRGWPAIEKVDLDGWSLRFSSGVTNRANSALPAGDLLGCPLAAAVDAVEREYSSRGLPTVFQLSEAAPAGLADELARRGYAEHSPTVVMVASVDGDGALPGSDDAGALAEARIKLADAPDEEWSSAEVRIELADAPDEEWLDLWWSVDGRGGPAEREVARRILTGVSSLYASLSVPGALGAMPVCVARLALVDDWGGVFAVATHPAARRRGFARELVTALGREARGRGVNALWLQVLADNAAALRLYRGLGFVPTSSYAYWSRP